jgi:hypothetical protein
MKKLFLTVLYFSIPVILFVFIADWFLTSSLKQSREGEFGVWNDIYNGKVNSDIVVYGSSRAMVHMDPRIISDSMQTTCYNLGINGHNFWLTYLRHKELLKFNKKPKLIIHSIDVFTLTKRPDLFNSDQFLPYMMNNRDVEEAISSYKGFGFYDFHLPLLRYSGKYKTIGGIFKYMIRPTASDSGRYRGFSAQNHSWNDDLERAKIKFADFRVDLDTASISLFDRYIRECIADGIEIVFVYTPEYIEGQEFVKNRREILDTFKEFAVKYNLKYIDYSADSISYQKKYFYNASHLNKEGAELFTAKLVNDLKKDNIPANAGFPGDSAGKKGNLADQ